MKMQLPFVLLLVCSITACGARNERRDVSRNQPPARPLEVYNRLGFIAGPPEYPAVARLTPVAGPADSAYVILSMSMPNSALRFQREASGFVAGYRIHATFLRDSTKIKELDRRESVRVSSFAETGRTEESIIFQDAVTLAPGRYVVQLKSNDMNSSRGFQVNDTIDVPAFGSQQHVSPPIVVLQRSPRRSAEARPEFLINTRSTVAYGGEPPTIYVERYGSSESAPLHVHLRDDAGDTVWAMQALSEHGEGALRYAEFSIPPEALSIGHLSLEVGEANQAAVTRVPLLVSISDEWMVANFDEILDVVRYIAHREEMDSLRNATGAERTRLWENFWARRDPYPAVPGNEFREEFFQRVRTATEEMAEPGLRGWKTDRGEVYIVLGPPSFIEERYVGRETSRPNLLEWHYREISGSRFTLQFFDRNGFGRYELTPASRTTFMGAAYRVRPR